jgi:hypothetical protein
MEFQWWTPWDSPNMTHDWQWKSTKPMESAGTRYKTRNFVIWKPNFTYFPCAGPNEIYLWEKFLFLY